MAKRVDALHPSAEDMITEWEDHEVNLYIKYLYKRKEIKDIEDIDDIVEELTGVFEENEVDGIKLYEWAKIKTFKPVKTKIKDFKVDDVQEEDRPKYLKKLFKNFRGIHTHLRKMKDGKIKSAKLPCKYKLEQLEDENPVNWDSETLEKYIAGAQYGKYYKYIAKFKSLNGHELLHKIEDKTADILKTPEFDITNVSDREGIWSIFEDMQENDVPSKEDIFSRWIIAVENRKNDNDHKKRKSNIAPYHNDKNPEDWSCEEVVAWLCSLNGGDYEQYKTQFMKNTFDGKDFKYLDVRLLKGPQYNIKKIAHQHEIVQAAKQLLKLYNNANLVTKRQYVSDLSTEPQILVKDGLVIVIAIGEYLEYCGKRDIFDISKDVKHYREVLGKMYNYKFMSSVDMKGNNGYKMSKEDIETYIGKECIPELSEGSTNITPKVNYDVLLVAFSGHGTDDAIICSDGNRIKYKKIRKWFTSNDAMKAIPRFFCVDACRVFRENDEDDNDDDDEEEKEVDDDNFVIRGDDEAPTVTITGQKEGATVKGGKVAKYLCNEWEKDFYDNKFKEDARYMRFGKLYKTAYNKLKQDTKYKKKTQTLRFAEHDPGIDNVVFIPCPISRGDEGVAQTDGTAPIIDDELTILLEPQSDSSKDLLKPYFFTLFKAGFKDNDSLRKLTKSDLDKLGITKIFDQKELLRRVEKLTNNT